MNKLIALLLVSTTILVTSCEDEEEPNYDNVDQVYLPVKLTATTFFKPGSYWVYEDSATSEIDSVWVSAASLQTDTTYLSDGSIYGIFEEMDVVMNDTAGNEFEYQIKPQNYLNDSIYILYKKKFENNNYIGRSIALLYPFDSAYCHQYGTNYACVENYYSSYSVGQMVFPNVTVVKDSLDITANDQVTLSYYSQGFGLIRREEKGTGKVWNVVDYNVVQ